MPTFRNETTRPVNHNAIIRPPGGTVRNVIVTFPPGSEVPLNFWVPYAQLGLTLVDPAFPPAPENILASGTFPITAGAERLFNIAPCDGYTLDVIAQTGSVVLYIGTGSVGIPISAASPTAYRYRGVQDWEYAPAVKVVGAEAGEFTLSAEVFRAGFGPMGGREPCR
jgi:hypothetical protein